MTPNVDRRIEPQIIEHLGVVVAIIIRNEYQKPGVSFFTPNQFSQQLAYMSHPKGKQIDPHLHNPVPRQVDFTLEVLFIKKGKIRVDFYDNDKIPLQSEVLVGGDCILLASGGHGFEILEDAEFIEVKQGPYVGSDADKTRFKKPNA